MWLSYAEKETNGQHEFTQFSRGCRRKSSPLPSAPSPALSHPGLKESCGSGQREPRGAQPWGDGSQGHDCSSQGMLLTHALSRQFSTMNGCDLAQGQEEVLKSTGRDCRGTVLVSSFIACDLGKTP